MNKNLWDLKQVVLDGRVRPRLDNLTLEIRPGITAIVGPSGAGKTSLLNVLVQFEFPESGTVCFHSPPNGRLPLYWVPQANGHWPHLSVGQHLMMASPEKNCTLAQVQPILEGFDLLENQDSYPDSLSQGELARLSLARAVATCASVIAMDEPMATVDEIQSPRYWKTLRELCEDSTSLVFASHDVESVVREAHHVVCLDQGKAQYNGPVSELYRQPATRKLAEFLGPINWFGPEEVSRWLTDSDMDVNSCRPEQVLVEKSANSPLRVTQVATGASLSELSVVHTGTHATRSLFYRLSKQPLGRDDHVLLRFIPLALLCLVMIGCGRADHENPLLKPRNVRHWPMPPAGPVIPAPRALQRSSQGELFVLDNAGRILVFDAQAKLQRQWEMPAHEVGKPEGLWIMQDGRIAVADTHYSRVVFFDSQGQVVGTLGKHGRGPQEFIYPVAITQDEQENFYVCEYGENDRVQKFSVEGKFLGAFGGFGTEPGKFQRPSGIVWHNHQVFVADAINNRIQVFSDEGEFKKVLGNSSSSWHLEYPYDLAKGVGGDLYLIEYGGGRVTRLGHDGKLLGRWGETGTALGQLATPWGIAVDGQGRVFIADTGNRRIVELQL